MRFIFITTLVVTLFSCNQKKENTTTIDNTNLQHICVKQLTDVIVHDIYAPPVASRIYAYSNLAFYEAIRFTDNSASSITAQLKGFDKIVTPNKNKQYNFYVAAIKSFFKTSTALVFSKDSMKQAELQILKPYKNSLSDEIYENSITLGDTIAAVILKRTTTDNYKQTRGMPKYSVFKEEGKWEQTPPDYADAAEPHWDKIKPMLLDSAAQFTLPSPPKYSIEKNSTYYKELMELYNTSKTLTPLQDTIARYWDDNPFVTQHEGHLMYANKKTTPGGHWQGITSILCKQQKQNTVTTARTYALISCAILDAFIACWHEKYVTRMVRPITVIQNNIDADWNSLLQTPPFPEYTSGHSTISAAAATILTKILGDNISFQDTTEKEYLGLERSFTSIMQAAEEVSISRLYGGIHYRSALENGFKQGEKIGNFYLEKIK
jgi:PAP2 superfamily